MAQADAYTRGGTDPLIPPHACGAGWRLAHLFNLAYRRVAPMPRGASGGVVVARLLAEKANGRRVPRRRSSCCTGSRHSDCSGMRGSIDRRIYGSTWDVCSTSTSASCRYSRRSACAPAAKERTPRCFAAGTALIRQAISASRESTPESRLTLARDLVLVNLPLPTGAAYGPHRRCIAACPMWGSNFHREAEAGGSDGPTPGSGFGSGRAKTTLPAVPSDGSRHLCGPNDVPLSSPVSRLTSSAPLMWVRQQLFSPTSRR